jgi:hypothetical protein
MTNWFFPDADPTNETVVERVRAFIGNLWGKTTTFVLGLLVVLIPYLQMADPVVLQQFPQLRTVIFIGGLVVILLRQFAPPPPAVSIQKDDKVTVHPDGQTVTITKAGLIDDRSVVSKPAGVTVAAAVAADQRKDD